MYIRRQDGAYFESVEGDYCQWGMRDRDMSVRWSTSPESIQALAQYLNGHLSLVCVRESYVRISGENRTRRFLGHDALHKTLTNSQEFDGYGEAEIIYAEPAAKLVSEVLYISGTGYIKKSSVEVCALMRRLADESEFPF